MTTKTEAAARYREIGSLPARPAKWRELRLGWEGVIDKESTGLTIRQEFAARVMAGFAASGRFMVQYEAAEVAVMWADALIASLSRGEGQ